MFKQFKRKLFYWLYLAFSVKLPANYRPLGKLSRAIRHANVQRFLLQCGEKLNIEKNANCSLDIVIGHRSMLGENCRVYGGTCIGNDVLMGPDVKIYTRNHRFDDIETPIHLQGVEQKPVTIKDDVWIGANVIILPGVTIGKGAVIGAGSIVTRSIPDYAVACGNPAKIKSSRLTIEKE